MKDKLHITFVCLGNICRSPMAEFIFRKMLLEAGMGQAVSVSSAATSDEEEGNGVYPPAQRELLKHGITCHGKRAIKLRRDDFDKSDYFLCMDYANLRAMHRIFARKEKQMLLTSFSAQGEREVADPWYTGDFCGVYHQIEESCKGLLKHVKKVLGGEI